MSNLLLTVPLLGSIFIVWFAVRDDVRELRKDQGPPAPWAPFVEWLRERSQTTRKPAASTRPFDWQRDARRSLSSPDGDR